MQLFITAIREQQEKSFFLDKYLCAFLATYYISSCNLNAQTFPQLWMNITISRKCNYTYFLDAHVHDSYTGINRRIEFQIIIRCTLYSVSTIIAEYTLKLAILLQLRINIRGPCKCELVLYVHVHVSAYIFCVLRFIQLGCIGNHYAYSVTVFPQASMYVFFFCRAEAEKIQDFLYFPIVC